MEMLNITLPECFFNIRHDIFKRYRLIPEFCFDKANRLESRALTGLLWHRRHLFSTNDTNETAPFSANDSFSAPMTPKKLPPVAQPELTPLAVMRGVVNQQWHNIEGVEEICKWCSGKKMREKNASQHNTIELRKIKKIWKKIAFFIWQK